jgi:predicted secreted protein
MGWLSGILVYLVVWWLVIFMVLPWGVKPPDNPEPGHATSAPDRPMLWRKVAITSVITAVVWVIIYLAIENSWVSFRP